MQVYTLLAFVSLSLFTTAQVPLSQYDPSDDSVHMWKPPPASAIADRAAPPRPVRRFPVLIAARPSGTCNGDARYCNLRFDQYTWPGTHNSAAYNLGLSCQYAKNAWKTFCPLASKFVPKEVYDCLWSNQAGHGVASQLAAGLRDFDMDTCQVGNRAVFCHGEGETMALGSELDAVFSIFRDFLQQNPTELINLTFGDVTGDRKIAMDYVAGRLQAYFRDQFAEKKSDGSWPTLGELVRQNKRVVVWISNKSSMSAQYSWANDPSIIYSTWAYTSTVTTSDALKNAMVAYCNNPTKPTMWQTLDASYSPSQKAVIDEITHFKKVELCFDKMAARVYQWLMSVAQLCSSKLRYIHRVHADQFWRGNIVEVARYLNEENLKKVAARKL